MTATTETRPSASSFKQEFIQLRAEGYSLREIGDQFDLSYERIRQVLGVDDPSRKPGWEPIEKRGREILRNTITAWLEKHGPVPRDKVLAEFGLTEGQLGTFVTEGIPAHLIIMSARTRSTEFSMDDIIKSIQRVWEVVRASEPHASGLSHARYETYRAQNDPSAPLIVSRYGWETVCDIASVPPGVGHRPKSSYVSSWSDNDILDAVARWISAARDQGKRPTYNGYDEWQRSYSDLPSGSTVRNRMRDAGMPKWPDIIAAAAERAA